MKSMQLNFTGARQEEAPNSLFFPDVRDFYSVRDPDYWYRITQRVADIFTQVNRNQAIDQEVEILIPPSPRLALIISLVFTRISGKVPLLIPAKSSSYEFDEPPLLMHHIQRITVLVGKIQPRHKIH